MATRLKTVEAIIVMERSPDPMNDQMNVVIT